MFYPALDVAGVDSDWLDPILDDFALTAVEPHASHTTFYFTDGANRDRAREAILHTWPAAYALARDVDDEDWARRSQENLRPVTVGRITIAPPWCVPASGPAAAGDRTVARPDSELPAVIVIAPSMGFGTGHHATTRLCLKALQTLDLRRRRVLDVGTGSGVLAIAARALGAVDAVGLDYDTDAIQAATENLDANPSIPPVTFIVGDLRTIALPPSDVVTANLTGALLVQTAALLLSSLTPDGTLIVSGLLAHERANVVAAFSADATLVWDEEEEGWIGLAFNLRQQSGSKL